MEQAAGQAPAYEQGMAGPPVSHEQMDTMQQEFAAPFGTSPVRHIFKTNSFRKLIDVPTSSSSSGLSIVAFRQNNLRHTRIEKSNPIHMEMPLDLATSTSLAVEASALKAAIWQEL